MELSAISPCLHMASVRGIGVALMARTCGACLHSTISSASSGDSDESSSFFDEEEDFCADEVFPDEDEDDSPPASAQAALSLSSPSISVSVSFSFSFSSARFLFSHPDFSLGPATVARSPRRTVPPTGPLLASAARCSTPNLCCSSTTASPRDLNTTSSEMSECVPITTWPSPLSMSLSAASRSFRDVLPVSNTTRGGFSNREKIFSRVVACCVASTSVGAMNAPWCPLPTAASNPSAATMVLPHPTSPCSSRSIGVVPDMS
mmetsp:Transcript_2163/g.10434  ORF Transcript_2163/g.10434 Transcript_2163/m.10434 type:complete len:262 (-) Transcript_2163:2962-3747(-)